MLTRIEGFAEEVLARDLQVKMPHQVLLRAVQRRVSRMIGVDMSCSLMNHSTYSVLWAMSVPGVSR